MAIESDQTRPGPVRQGLPRFEWTGEIAPGWLERAFANRKTVPRLVTLFCLLMLVFSIPPLFNNIRFLLNKDYDLWYWTGWYYRHGLLIYPRKHSQLFPFMYPPSCAVMLAVASAAGVHGYLVLLLLINSLAWVATILSSLALCGYSGTRSNKVLLAILPSLCVIPFVHDTYLLGQSSLLLLALMLGAFLALRKGKEMSAGVLVALAAGIKAYPVMALGYFIYRRHWKGAAAMVVTLALLLVVAPLAFRTPAQAWEDLNLWTKGMVLKYDSKTIAQRPERCYSFKNQSLIALENRLLRRVPADGEADPFWMVNGFNLSFRATNIALVASGLAICLFFVAVMPRRRERSDQALALEGSMLLIMILMFAPLSFNYSYVWMIFPLSVVLSLALNSPAGSRDRRLYASGFGLAVGLLALSICIPKTAQAYGNVLVSAFVLFLIAGRALWQEKTRAARAEVRSQDQEVAERTATPRPLAIGRRKAAGWDAPTAIRREE